MNKSKSSASSIFVSSTFAIDVLHGAQFLNATYVSRAALTVILPLTKM